MKRVWGLLLLCSITSLIGAEPVFKIPRMKNIKIDGKADDWDKHGLRVGMLSPISGTSRPVPTKHVNDHDTELRIGWNDEGLLLLIKRRDDKWVEEPKQKILGRCDAFEVYLSPVRGNPNICQWAIGPGMDPEQPEVRVQYYDYRKDKKLKAVPMSATVVRRKVGDECVLEALIPWNVLAIEPTVGREIAMQFWSRDADSFENPGEYFAAWYPKTGAFRESTLMHRVQLAAEAGPPLLARVVFGYDLTKAQPYVTVTARPEAIGREALLQRGKDVVARQTFEKDETGYAVADFRLPRPRLDEPYGKLDVVVDGATVDIVDLPLTDALSIWMHGRHGRWEWVKGMHLDKETDRALQAEIRKRFPNGGPLNVVRNTRYSLGMPCGWMVKSHRYDNRRFNTGKKAKVFADPAIIGPSGAPALCLETERESSLFSEPIKLSFPVTAHRMSFAVRSKGSWRVRVVSFAGQGKIASELLLNPEKDGWQQVALDFPASPDTPAVMLEIAGRGKLHLDNLQCGPVWYLERNPAPPKQCEVALALPKSDASAGGIQFADEPAVLRYCASAVPANALLVATVTDLYGRTKTLRPVKLQGKEFLRYGQLKYDVFTDRPLGAFRINAHVEVNGRRVSPINEIVVNRVRRPRYWGRDAPNSPFGGHFFATEQQQIMHKAIGINWARFHDIGHHYTNWYFVEPKKGKWVFQDDEVKSYRKHNIMLLAELGTAPKWASYLKNTDTGRIGWTSYADRYMRPLSLKDYGEYVRTVATRYRGIISAYHPWNEPWGVNFNMPIGYDKKAGRYVEGKEPEKFFAEMMRVAYREIKAVDPAAFVLGFNTSGDPHGARWSRGVMAAGGLEWCDAVDYHQYVRRRCGFPGDDVSNGLYRAFQPITEKFGKVPKPVWMSEGCGGGASLNLGLYKYAVPYVHLDDYRASADLQCRYILSLLANHVQKVFLYSSNFGGLGRGGRHTIVCEDGSLHPSGVAISNLAWHLEDTKPVGISKIAAGVFAYLFAGRDRTVAVISGPVDNSCELPKDLPAVDLFGNPLPAGSAYDGTLIFLSTDKPVEDLLSLLRNNEG